MKSTEDLRLGKQYLKIRSYDKALEHLTKAVILGDRAAVSLLYKLGVHFFDEKEYKKAEQAFQLLAGRGHAESCIYLGKIVNTGIRDGRISRRLLAIMQKLTGWGFRAVLTRQAN